jgi:SagB-type dehydrogenase family enzyme
VEHPDVERSDGIGLRNAQIWEMRLPVRPRFVSDLLAIPVGTGIHLIGADPLTLGGASATWVIEDLAPLLDGTRTVASLLAEVSDVSESSLLDVLHLLHMHGMLEEGEDVSAPQWRVEITRRFGPQMEYFSRYLRVTGHCRNRFQAQRALLGARVNIAGDPAWTPLLARQLASSGVGEVFCAAHCPDDAEAGAVAWDAPGPAELPEIDLVVCIGGDLVQEATAHECLAQNYTLLCLDPSSLQIGPLTYPGVSACPVCARSQLTRPRTPPDALHAPVHRMWSFAVVSRAAQLVIGHLTGLFQPQVVGGVEIWSPHNGEARLQEVLRLSGCALCGHDIGPLTVTLPGGAKDSMALLYHRNAAIQPWHIAQPAGMQRHLSPDTRRLTRGAFLRHDWAERVRLPAPAQAGSGAADQFASDRSVINGVQGLATLGNVLHYSAGGRSWPTSDGGYHLVRHTASGGNLGSAEVFLVSPEGSALDPGLYHYLLVDHSLERLRSGQLIDPLAECALDGSPQAAHRFLAGAEAVLVIVSAVQRLCAKYSERGYFYGLLDAGLMAHRLELLASAVSLWCRQTWDFDDQGLAKLLGVDGANLAPTMVVALGRPASGDAHCERPRS